MLVPMVRLYEPLLELFERAFLPNVILVFVLVPPVPNSSPLMVALLDTNNLSLILAKLATVRELFNAVVEPTVREPVMFSEPPTDDEPTRAKEAADRVPVTEVLPITAKFLPTFILLLVEMSPRA